MKEAAEAYDAGKPFLSNEEYDALERIHGQLIGGTGDVPHVHRMYSLQKHYDKDGQAPLTSADGVLIKSPKLDGAAIDITYIDGEISHSLTRGDGIKGRDITDKAIALNIPTKLPNVYLVDNPITQITGEVVALADVENSRNYASGALGLKDLTEFEQRKTEGQMIFVAYNVQTAQNRWGVTPTYLEDMRALKALGFNVITEGDYSQYPTDGIVYRLNDNVKFNAKGFTDKFPKGAYAWKEEQESVVTTLLDVVWQTGKSGKVTPVAILEPVMIGEANVARATLNNISFIEALDLEIGCQVEVIRSGEIIPKIIGKV